jgi:MinD superfamily P-loop ATPase
MRIAIASGKGGTGKTTVSVSLALAARRPCQLLDCDVEEPNAHLFLNSDLVRSREVEIPVPEIDGSRCNGCGVCAEVCAFNALVCFGAAPVLVPDMCHGCGVCMRACPQKAIREAGRRIGVIERLKAGNVELIQGRLDVGVSQPVPLVRAVKEETEGDLVLLDAPPGTSCPVVATIRDSDFVVLVADPTPFGLSDLKLAAEVVREMRLPFGIVINRASEEDAFVRPFAKAEGIPVLAEFPDDRRVATAYAKGIPFVDALPGGRGMFLNLWRAIEERA